MSDRVQRAREEIGHRRALAQAATPGPWKRDRLGVFTVREGGIVGILAGLSATPADAAHIAANDPAHVLAVLDAAESVLDRHQVQLPEYGGHWCDACDLAAWPCRDTLAVLDLYAPEATQ